MNPYLSHHGVNSWWLKTVGEECRCKFVIWSLEKNHQWDLLENVAPGELLGLGVSRGK